MVVIPLAEMIARVFGGGVRGSGPLVAHLTLWVCFLGSALAAREDRLLAFGTGEIIKHGRLKRWAVLLSSTVAAGVAGLLFRAGWTLIAVEQESAMMVTQGIPVWWTQLVIPVAFGLIGVRLAWMAGPNWPERLLGAIGFLGGVLLAENFEILDGNPVWPGLMLILVATLAGGPIFAVLGGIAALLFMAEGVPPVAVLVESYRMSVSPTLPAIPLFTLVGFFLAEGNAAARLLRFFRAFFGWIPGGTALVCTVLCAFFTVTTGGSGVTILALGGLLILALRKDGYGERFSLGLLTGSGSLGLLFPPALPLILYGIVAQIPIEDLFIGGLIPGILMVTLVAIWGIREGIRAGVPRSKVEVGEAKEALWEAKWELMLPLVAIVAIFSGFATLVEAAAVTAVYAFITQALIHRDLSFTRDLPRVLLNCIVLIGGVLLILSVAMGFSSWVVDAQIPARLLELAVEKIDSPLLFLLTLNVFLLLVGCLMDIFSATVVVVPLIVPIANAFGIDPIHLGIIFVANLELGYITPPVGLNLFFASYRFEKPLLSIYHAAIPMLLIMGLGVLLITYLPWLTTFLVGVIRG